MPEPPNAKEEWIESTAHWLHFQGLLRARRRAKAIRKIRITEPQNDGPEEKDDA